MTLNLVISFVVFFNEPVFSLEKWLNKNITKEFNCICMCIKHNDILKIVHANNFMGSLAIFLMSFIMYVYRYIYSPTMILVA